VQGSQPQASWWGGLINRAETLKRHLTFDKSIRYWLQGQQATHQQSMHFTSHFFSQLVAPNLLWTEALQGLILNPDCTAGRILSYPVINPPAPTLE
jgi:hypothetical protein